MGALEHDDEVGEGRLAHRLGDAEVQAHIGGDGSHGDHVDVLEDERPDPARHDPGHGRGDLVEGGERGQHRGGVGAAGGGASASPRSRAPACPRSRSSSWVRSYPVEVFTNLPPVRMTSPLASTASRPSTWWRVTPYLTARMPPALVATLPPSEALDSPGEHGVDEPVLGQGAVELPRGSPRAGPRPRGCRGRSRGSASIRSKETRIPSGGEMAAPESPVPLPRAVTGTWSSSAISQHGGHLGGGPRAHHGQGEAGRGGERLVVGVVGVDVVARRGRCRHPRPRRATRRSRPRLPPARVLSSP